MYYKDMEVWKEAMNLVLEVYRLTEHFPKHELYGLTSQMRRAVVSIPSNIAEGSAKYSDKDISRFVDASLGSIAELDTQLDIAIRLGYCSESPMLVQQLSKVSALLRGLKKYLNDNQRA